MPHVGFWNGVMAIDQWGQVGEYQITHTSLVYSPWGFRVEMKYVAIKYIYIGIVNAPCGILKRRDGYRPVRSSWWVPDYTHLTGL
jgi:hypothetical protein